MTTSTLKNRPTRRYHGEDWEARVDAYDTIRIGPLKPSDFKARAKNPLHCVVARACDRQRLVEGGWHISRAWIGSYVVDVQFREDPKVLYRYWLSKEDAKRVRQFDLNPGAVKSLADWANEIYVTLEPAPKGKKLGWRSGKTGKKRGSGQGYIKQPPVRHLFSEPV